MVADAVCQKGRFRRRRNLRQLLQDLQCLQDGQCIPEANGARWLSVIRDLQAIVIWPDLPFS